MPVLQHDFGSWRQRGRIVLRGMFRRLLAIAVTGLLAASMLVVVTVAGFIPVASAAAPTIPLSGEPIAVDADTHTLFDTAAGGFTMVDTSQCNAGDQSGCPTTAPPSFALPGGAYVREFALDEAKNTLYVVGSSGNGINIYLIDTATCNATSLSQSGCNPVATVNCDCGSATTMEGVLGETVDADPANPSLYLIEQEVTGYNGLGEPSQWDMSLTMLNTATCNALNPPVSATGCPGSATTVSTAGGPFGTGYSNYLTNILADYDPANSPPTDTLYVNATGNISVIDADSCNPGDTSGCTSPVTTISFTAPGNTSISAPSGSIAIDDEGAAPGSATNTDTLYVTTSWVNDQLPYQLNTPTQAEVESVNALTCNSKNTSDCSPTNTVTPTSPTNYMTPVYESSDNNISVDPSTGLVYFESTYANNFIPTGGGTHPFDSSIAVIDGPACRTADNSECAAAVGTVQVGDGPAGMAIDSDNASTDGNPSVYVVNTGFAVTVPPGCEVKMPPPGCPTPGWDDDMSIFPTQAPTTTALTSTVAGNNPVVGQPITYTATVSADDPQLFAPGWAPQGSVTFTSATYNEAQGGFNPPVDIPSCTALQLGVAGAASCGPQDYPDVQLLQICATFTPTFDSPPGSLDYLQPSSSCIHTPVSPAETSMTLSSTTTTWPGPPYGYPVAYTATVSADAPSAGLDPTGTVEFEENGHAGLQDIPGCSAVPVNSASQGSVATCSTPSPAGTNPITARYVPSGGANANFYPAAAQVTQVVQPEQTGTTGTATLANGNPVTAGTPISYGTPITYHAQVDTDIPGPSLLNIVPAGSVTFSAGGTALCTATLAGAGAFSAAGSCVSGQAPLGTDVVSASYQPGPANLLGQENFVTSNASFTETVGPVVTGTYLCPLNGPCPPGSLSVVVGTPETYVAQVVSASPSTATPPGTVTFKDNGQTVSGCVNVPLSGGLADCTVPGYPHVAPATHTISATYSPGNPAFGASEDDIAVTVTPDLTSTVFTSVPATSHFGQRVILKATVSAHGPYTATPTGKVAFYENGKLVAKTGLAATSTPGQAIADTSTVSLQATPGPLAFTVRFSPSGPIPDFLPSQGAGSVTVLADGSIVNATHHGNISVTTSEAIINSVVDGSVTVAAGASLDVENSTINGTVIAANGAAEVRVCGSAVADNLIVKNAAGLVIIGDPGDALCAPNNGIPNGVNGKGINGALALEGNHHGVEAIDNTVGHLTAVGNTGPGPYPGDTTQIAGNKVG